MWRVSISIVHARRYCERPRSSVWPGGIRSMMNGFIYFNDLYGGWITYINNVVGTRHFTHLTKIHTCPLRMPNWERVTFVRAMWPRIVTVRASNEATWSAQWRSRFRNTPYNINLIVCCLYAVTMYNACCKYVGVCALVHVWVQCILHGCARGCIWCVHGWAHKLRTAWSSTQWRHARGDRRHILFPSGWSTSQSEIATHTSRVFPLIEKWTPCSNVAIALPTAKY